MVSSRAVILVLALVLLALGVRVPFLTSASSSATPPSVAIAVDLAARPLTPSSVHRLDPGVPLLPPTVLRAALSAGMASGTGPTTAYQLQADLDSGGGVAVNWSRRAWLALSLLLVAAVATVSGRQAEREGGSPVAVAAPLVVLLAPLSVGAVTQVDPALVASTLAVMGLLFLVPRSGPRGAVDAAPGLWSAMGGAFLVGVGVAAHGAGVLLAPIPVVLALFGSRGGMGVRLVTAITALAVGVVVGDPRLAEDPAILSRRIETLLAGTPSLGHVWLGERLLRGLSPVPLALAAVAGMGIPLRSRDRATIVALLLPVAAALVVPSAGLSTAVLITPFVAILAGLGVGVVARWLAPRRAPAVVAVVLLVLGPALLVATRIGQAQKGDSRDAAAAWLARNLPASSRVVTDYYGPEIPPGRITFVLPFDVNHPEAYAGAFDLGWYHGFDTFILVGTQVERYRRDPDTYARQLTFIDRLHAFCVRAALFERGDYAGPTVEILVRDAPPGADRFLELLEAEPPDPPAPDFYVALGRAYHRMGQMESARVLYRVAQVLVPHDPELAVSLGEVYIEDGNLMAADSLLAAATRRAPEHPMVRYQYGRVKHKRKQFGEAIAEYKMAIRGNPGFIEAHFNLAAAYLQAGNERGALNSYRKVQELLPSGPLREEADAMIAAITEAIGGS
jgi:tetratricopeptide (TPR) repeat protein